MLILLTILALMLFQTVAGQDPVPFQNSKGLWGYRVNGIELVPCQYKWAFEFHEGRAAVCKLVDRGSYDELHCGYINTEGKEVIPLLYGSVKSFNNGIAKVTLDFKTCFIDINGTIRTDEEARRLWEMDAANFNFGLAPFKSENGYYGYIDRKGAIIFDPTLKSAEVFSNNATAIIMDEKGRKFTVDTNFNEVGTDRNLLPPVWRQGKNGKYGVTVGAKTLVHAIYDEVVLYQDDYAAVRQGDVWGVCNRWGTEIIPVVCQKILPPVTGAKNLVQEDVVIVKLQGKYGLVDIGGNALGPLCDEVHPYYKGLASVTPNAGKGWGYLNKEGKLAAIDSGTVVSYFYSDLGKLEVYKPAIDAFSGYGLRLKNDVLILPYFTSITLSDGVLTCIKNQDTCHIKPKGLTASESDDIETLDKADIKCIACLGSGVTTVTSNVKGKENSTTTIQKQTSDETRWNTSTNQYDHYTKTTYTPVTTTTYGSDYSQSSDAPCPFCNGTGKVKGTNQMHLIWDQQNYKYVGR